MQYAWLLPVVRRRWFRRLATWFGVTITAAFDAEFWDGDSALRYGVCVGHGENIRQLFFIGKRVPHGWRSCLADVLD